MRAALLLDVDGVLAPIVDVPHEAAVPEETRVELRRLHARYALVGCISGRAGTDARRVVGLDELVYVGEHGLELVPEASAWSERLLGLAATVDWEDVERKPLTITFHYRRAEDEAEAVRFLEAVATRARAEGFVARFGRKVLELRPPLAADKGTAVAHLLGERGLRRALYAGDDTTDLDAFRALAAARARRGGRGRVGGGACRAPRGRRRGGRQPRGVPGALAAALAGAATRCRARARPRPRPRPRARRGGST